LTSNQLINSTYYCGGEKILLPPVVSALQVLATPGSDELQSRFKWWNV